MPQIAPVPDAPPEILRLNGFEPHDNGLDTDTPLDLAENRRRDKQRRASFIASKSDRTRLKDEAKRLRKLAIADVDPATRSRVSKPITDFRFSNSENNKKSKPVSFFHALGVRAGHLISQALSITTQPIPNETLPHKLSRGMKTNEFFEGLASTAGKDSLIEMLGFLGIDVKPGKLQKLADKVTASEENLAPLISSMHVDTLSKKKNHFRSHLMSGIGNMLKFLKSEGKFHPLKNALEKLRVEWPAIIVN